jgi:hypothetical protein
MNLNLKKLKNEIGLLKTEEKYLWYLCPSISNLFQNYFQLQTQDSYQDKRDFINFITEQIFQKNILFSQELPLGLDVNDYERSIKNITKLIIHHTAHNLEDLNFEKDFDINYFPYLSTLQLLNLFVRYHLDKSNELYKKPIFSGRNLNNLKQINPKTLAVESSEKVNYNFSSFICYHYMIFPDGKVWQTNADEEFLWHSSGVNLESLGICLIGNFDDKFPTSSALSSARNLINSLKSQYKIDSNNIFGHRESHPKHSDNNCPGKTFLVKIAGKSIY